MAGVTTTIYCKSVGSYSAAAGGTIQLDFTHGGRFVEDRVADQTYPTFTAVVDKFLEVTVHLRDLSTSKALALGAAAADLACTLAGAADVTITFAKMKLHHVEGGQSRAHAGALRLVFRHESTDGTTAPVS
jgi:hypothetical protein